MRIGGEEDSFAEVGSHVIGFCLVGWTARGILVLWMSKRLNPLLMTTSISPRLIIIRLILFPIVMNL